MIKTILVSALIMIGLIVLSSNQIVKGYMTDEERLQARQSQVEKQVKRDLPIFEQQCKAELGIPEDHPLGSRFLECKDTISKLENNSLISR